MLLTRIVRGHTRIIPTPANAHFCVCALPDLDMASTRRGLATASKKYLGRRAPNVGTRDVDRAQNRDFEAVDRARTRDGRGRRLADPW